MTVKVSKQGLLCTKKKTLFFPPSLFLWLNQEVIGIMFTIVDCCVFLFLLHVDWDPYRKVKSMLKNLKLEDLLQKFFDNCIRVSFEYLSIAT